MGFLRKTVKKIGKAIKKVVKKVGSAFGKLGVVGQIGLMMFMPQLAGTLWGKLGSFATKGTSLFHKAVGAVYNAGSAIGNVYKTVTQAISNGFDRAGNFLKGEGFTLTDPSKGFFGAEAEYAKLTDADTLFDVTPETKAFHKNIKIADTGITIDKTGVDLMKPDATNIQTFDKPSLLGKVKDDAVEFFEGSMKGVRDAFANPGELVKDSIESGARSGLSSRIASQIAGEPPIQRVIRTNFDVMNMNSHSQGGIINQVDFTAGNNAYQSMGSSWGAVNSVAAPYLTKEIFSGGDIQYANRVSKLRFGSGI
tara:strand:- start:1106 stop:2032 length:927 start_codon:yes stop_codon:yes gene_type:complete